MSTTEDILKEMLTEDTGTHFLDSGGAYGRHWQRNQGRDFDSEPETVLDVDSGLLITHSLYHWLLDRLDYNEEIDNLFYNEYEPTQDKDLTWLGLMEDFPHWLGQRLDLPITGLYGDGEPFTINTYNGEDLLSQVIQYLYMEIDGQAVILLQIHGGCDVRGGYTKPRAFSVYDQQILYNAHATILCPNGHYWYTDDAYHWYDEGAAGLSAGKQLEDYPVVLVDDDDIPDEPYIKVQDGKAYCPKCQGELAATF